MDQAQPTNKAQQPGMGKILLIGIFPVLLINLNLFMSIFAPFPLALTSVIYGRQKGALAMLAGLFACVFLIQTLKVDIAILMIMLFCGFIAFSLSEVVIRQINPIRGIMGIGAIMTLIATLMVTITVTQTNKTLKELLVIEFKKSQPLIEEQRKKIKEQGGQSSFEFEALISQPELLADEVLKEAPGYFLAGIFLALWFNLFLLLKSNRLVNKTKQYKFNESYLLNFKVPDHGIWIVIIGLALTIWGDTLGLWFSTVGLTILKAIGVFYFFQGFGIYLAFLDYVRVTGFFRSMLVVLTIFTAGALLAIIGLADMFVDFKKLMQRKKDQGDL